MTDNPPAGKTWVTIEVESGTDWDTADTIMGHPVKRTSVGSAPETPWDKFIRLMGEAEDKFRNSFSIVDGPAQTGVKLGIAASTLADALKVFREEM